MKKRRKKRKKSTKLRYTRRIVIATIILFTVALAGCLFFITRQPTKHIVNINKNSYPIRGIDISNHNGDIDFKRVAADTITFVYIKASEGSNYKDPRFEHNHKCASAAGLKVGAYHFFRKSKDGVEQANNFLKVVKGHKFDLPLVVDVEDWSNDFLSSDKDAIGNLTTMIDCLDSHGVRTMIYTNKSGYKKYIKDNFSHKHLWLCTFTPPEELAHFNWNIQQYSHWGNVDGIEGEVDLNIFNGTREQWEAWLQE